MNLGSRGGVWIRMLWVTIGGHRVEKRGPEVINSFDSVADGVATFVRVRSRIGILVGSRWNF